MRFLNMFFLVFYCANAALLAQGKKPDSVRKEAGIATADVSAARTEPAVSATTAEFSLVGTIGFAYAEGTYALTAGGPKFGIRFGDFSFCAGLFPSLVYSEAYRNNSSAATPVRPNLGAGFEIGFRKISIITPVYYMPRDSYHYTIGLAYKFS